MDKRINNGGARKGAGRKSKAAEQKNNGRSNYSLNTSMANLSKG